MEQLGSVDNSEGERSLARFDLDSAQASWASAISNCRWVELRSGY